MAELEERCKKYKRLTEEALKLAKISIPKEGFLYEIATDFINMAKNYLEDGKYYEEQKKYDIALASYAYAHAWLDALARLGLIETNKNYKLFTLYK